MVALLLTLALSWPVAAQNPEIRLTSVVSGISAPTDIQNAADGSNRLFLVEQSGIIRILKNGAVNTQPFLDIRTRVGGGGERGLLGLAFPLGFSSKQRFYVFYTNQSGNLVVAMYAVTANPDIANASSETVLLTINHQANSNHNGGQLRFGSSGNLYIGTGDGGGAGDAPGNAQNRQSLLGKILRVDVESQPGNVLIPPDNPFAGSGTTRPEIWAVGLRNPWRFSFDRGSGDLWIADVGQDAWEEVNFQSAASPGGQNYGWNTMEGAHCYATGNCNTQGLVPPAFEYDHSQGCSVTGGFVHRGPSAPTLNGAYVYADYCSGNLWALQRSGNQFSNRLVLATGLRVTTFGEDEVGDVYLAGGGTIYKLDSPLPATAMLTIASSPTGLKFTLDQDALQYTAPHTFTLPVGSNHTVTWIESESGGTRFGFTGWSDNIGGNPRTIAIGQSASSYTASFVTQFLLTTNTSAGGSMLLTPATGGWYHTGAAVQATATPNAGFHFNGFSGCVSSASTSVSFTMTAPCTLNAQFAADTASPPEGLRFVPVTPCRIMDTRDPAKPASLGPPRLTAGTRRDVAMTQSSCAIPNSARAYALNVTVVPAAALGFLTMWPRGMNQPVVSTLNSPRGYVVANAAIVPAGVNGDISVFVTDATDVILDLTGYFIDAANGLGFFPTAPCRAVDTRGESGQAGVFGPPVMTAGSRRDFPLTQGPCGLPGAAEAYSMNATVVPEGPLAYLTLWPGALAQPLVSTLNSFEGRTLANAAILSDGATRSVSAFVTGRSHLILDTNGYFAPNTTPGGLLFYPVNPCRVVDTRAGSGKTGAFGSPAMNGGAQRDFPIPQSNCGIPSTARAYALNVTVIPHTTLDYLTLWPTGQSRPFVSTLNSFDGVITANAALAPAGSNGVLSVFVTHPTDLVIDIGGYFAP